MEKFITIEIDRCNKKWPIIVGHLCAEGVDDAYEQMANDHPNDRDEVLIVKPTEVNQLIIDLNKMARKI